MNDAALNQLPVNMHDLEEEGNANGFVCLSVCLSDKVAFVLADIVKATNGDQHETRWP